MLNRSPSMVEAHQGSVETDGSQQPGDLSVTPIKNIADLAAIAGVAVSTVSRAIANKPGVKLETRDRIQQLAKLHSFCINTYAQNLRAGKGGERQAALPSFLNPSEPPPDAFPLRLLKTIFDQATRSGFDVRSRRVEIGHTAELAATVPQFGDQIRASRNDPSCPTPVTFQIMLNSFGTAECKVGYCVELTAQNVASTNKNKS
jgi:hypothetical protein